MKTYKNYLVETSKHDWTYGFFTDFETAKTFSRQLTVKDADFIEVIGTDEDPDTFTSCETVFIWDVSGSKEIYKGYGIDFNIYGSNEYSVQYCGDDFMFKTLEEAKAFIDTLD